MALVVERATDQIEIGNGGRLDGAVVRKRDERQAPFDRGRIAHAIEMAFRAEVGNPYPDPLAAAVVDRIEAVTDAVVAALPEPSGPDPIAGVEEIQDEVERQLMAAGAFAVARRYILYRE